MLTGRRAGWAALWQGHWGWILAETIQVYKGPIEPGSYFGRSSQWKHEVHGSDAR